MEDPILSDGWWIYNWSIESTNWSIDSTQPLSKSYHDFSETDKLILKFTWKCEVPRIAKTILFQQFWLIWTKLQDFHCLITRLIVKMQWSRMRLRQKDSTEIRVWQIDFIKCHIVNTWDFRVHVAMTQHSCHSAKAAQTKCKHMGMAVFNKTSLTKKCVGWFGSQTKLCDPYYKSVE